MATESLRAAENLRGVGLHTIWRTACGTGLTRAAFLRIDARQRQPALGWLAPVAFWAALLLAAPAAADLTDLSLEELMNVEVTSVSKKPESRAAAADAIYVLTDQDIRRSGVRTITDALRLVPGVQVARIDSNKWAVGIRGFGSRLARSVLVLMDGRTVYNPLFAGTYWEIQDTALDDIARIEVIRGPGGAYWGANAFNGVINIITKDAALTQGGLLMARGGSEEQGAATVRYGGAVGESLRYRAYAKYLNRDGGYTPAPDDYDDWQMGRAGFRLDWRPQAIDWMTLQGDLYDAQLGNRVVVTHFMPPYREILQKPSDASGGNLLGRWTRALSGNSSMALQMYYDHTFRRDPNFREQRDTFDIDLQHRFHWFARQEIVSGLEYRLTSDHTAGAEGVALAPNDRTDNLITAFVQDEIALLPELLHLTVGSKFEHNDYSGFEYQPNGRLLWTPLADHTFWGSIGRSVRTPSRIEEDALITGSPVNLDPANPNQCTPSGAECVFPRAFGNSSFKSEEMLAYQIGHRVRVTPRLYLDSVAFYQNYDNLLSTERGSPFAEAAPPLPHQILPVTLENRVHGESYGVEIAADAFVTDDWRLHAGYSFLHLRLTAQNGSTDLSQPRIEGSSPQNQAFLRSQLDLPWNFAFDANLRYVDSLPGLGVDDYVTFDVRLGFDVTPELELSAVGQDLAQEHHSEFPGGTEVERSAYGQVRWRW